MNLLEVLTPFAAFLGGPPTQEKEHWRAVNSVVNPSWRVYESQKVWYETHQYFSRLSKIERLLN
jgi:hypothetical protein